MLELRSGCFSASLRQTVTALIVCSSQIWIGGGFVSMSSTPGVSPEQRGWLVSMSQIIELAVIWPGVWMSSLLGKRAVLQMAAVPTVAAYVLLSQADHIVDLFIARALQGVSSGLVNGVLPLYLTDVVVADSRGRFDHLQIFMWYLGVSLTSSTAPFISVVPLTLILLALTLIWALSVCLVPESPWYYFDRGREAKALESLSWLRGSQDVARREYDTTVSGRIQASWRELLCKQTTVISVVAVLHWAFVPARLAYSRQTFISITEDERTSTGLQLGQAIFCLVGSAVSPLLLASTKRRTLLVRSLILALLSAVPTTVYMFYMNQYDSASYIYMDPIAIGLTVLYPVLSSMTFQPLTYVLSTEILYKDKHRKAAIYLAHLAAFLSAVSCAVVPVLKRVDMDYVNSSILAVTVIISLVFIFVCLPETKNKNIFEINRLFRH